MGRKAAQPRTVEFHVEGRDAPVIGIVYDKSAVEVLLDSVTESYPNLSLQERLDIVAQYWARADVDETQGGRGSMHDLLGGSNRLAHGETPDVIAGWCRRWEWWHAAWRWCLWLGVIVTLTAWWVSPLSRWPAVRLTMFVASAVLSFISLVCARIGIAMWRRHFDPGDFKVLSHDDFLAMLQRAAARQVTPASVETNTSPLTRRP